MRHGEVAAKIMLENVLPNLPIGLSDDECGFLSVMVEYRIWAEDVLFFLNSIDQSLLGLGPLVPDVRQVIRSYQRWTSLIDWF